MLSMIYPAQWATAVRGDWGGQSGWRHLLALMNEAIRLSSAFSPLSEPSPRASPPAQLTSQAVASQGACQAGRVCAALLGLYNH